jgi:hypothetical protein
MGVIKIAPQTERMVRKEASEMSTKTLTPLSNVSDVFATSPREDQEEIFNIGTAFRVLGLQKRLAHAQENVRRLEAKYGPRHVGEQGVARGC